HDRVVELGQPRQRLRQHVCAHVRGELLRTVIHLSGHTCSLFSVSTRIPGATYGATPTLESPEVSGRSNAIFIDWIAAPAVPLARLSTAAVRTALPDRASTSIPIWTAFEPSTDDVIGWTPVGRT